MPAAITDCMEWEDRRQTVKDDALKAWALYRETGRHVATQEVDQWLSSLIEGRDENPPECRCVFPDWA